VLTSFFPFPARSLVIAGRKGGPHALQAQIKAQGKSDQGAGERASDHAGGELGDYYVVDESRNCITHKQLDLEELGLELGVLGAFETVVEDERDR
jgi:hypothetical protein